MVQVHVPATVWGFESLRWHQGTVNFCGLQVFENPSLIQSSGLFSYQFTLGGIVFNIKPFRVNFMSRVVG